MRKISAGISLACLLVSVWFWLPAVLHGGMPPLKSWLLTVPALIARGILGPSRETEK